MSLSFLLTMVTHKNRKIFSEEFKCLKALRNLLLVASRLIKTSSPNRLLKLKNFSAHVHFLTLIFFHFVLTFIRAVSTKTQKLSPMYRTSPEYRCYQMHLLVPVTIKRIRKLIPFQCTQCKTEV